MPDPPQSRYVPPHLRNRPVSSSSSSTSHAAPATSQRGYDSRSAPSRTPWGPGLGLAGRSSYANDSAGPSRTSYSGVAEGSRTPGRNAQSAPTRPGQSYGVGRGVGVSVGASGGGGGGGGGGSPSLHVFGDSFVGPMKLLSDDCASVRTFKGASAKGLDNPKSMKQVSRDLLPELQRLLAPPPYVYQPSNGRWVLLIFGNVDLQINYLWQLQHKRISSLSFRPPSASFEIDHEEITELRASSDTARTETAGTAGTGLDAEPETGPAVLASATETTLRGPALGPELFVSTVLRAYTNFLEREIVNGPVGQRLRESAEARRQALEASTAGEGAGSATATGGPGTGPKSTSGPRRRLPPPGKVLVAGALPPLVEDEVLSRIPEKYVERLEEEHEKAHRAMGHAASASPLPSASGTAIVPAGSGSRTPWAKGDNFGSGETAETASIEVGLATVSLTDRPVTPRSLSSSSSKESSLFDNNLNNSTLSSGTEPSAPAPAPAPASAAAPTSSPSAKPSSSTSPTITSKTPVSALLEHDPPLCTLGVRVRMTNLFNSGLSHFCAKHPDILSFVDITPRMRAHDDSSGWTSSSGREHEFGEVDRSTWACPVDPTNVHPLWEPTLPLWLEALKEVGVPTDGFGISKDAEETFRAYEKDKRRRTGLDEEAGEAEGGRIKLRDE